MVMRISGMASGMDIDKIVSDLMKAERMPLDKMNQNQQKLAWKTDLYREINTKLASFRDTLNGMRFSSALNATKAVSSDPAAVTVSSNNNAVPVSHTINVASLATAALCTSSAPISADPSNKININDTLQNNQNKFSTPLTTGQFTINGQTIAYSGTDTFASIMSKVNTSSAGVVMSYDSVADKVKFISKTTGSASTINISGDTGNLIANLNLNTTSAAGGDAHVFVDGIESFRPTNSFTLDGVTYSLNKATASDIAVNVQQDTDALFNTIKDFVSQYNDTIGLIVQRNNEVKIKGYDPLTDDQKLNMKDNDITLWETKAKSGLLQNDSILSNAYTNLRSNFSSTVNNLQTSYNALSQIGITTVSFSGNGYNPDNAGKIQLDEAKLKDALSQDPSGVMSLFTNHPANGSQSDTGIAQRMYDQINDSITKLNQKAGRSGGSPVDRSTTLGNQMYNLELQIDLFKSKLSSKEDNYYKKFTAMDNAIAKGNSQLSWLSKNMG
jgi:flagellar hook-associated protein 2